MNKERKKKKKRKERKGKEEERGKGKVGNNSSRVNWNISFQRFGLQIYPYVSV